MDHNFSKAVVFSRHPSTPYLRGMYSALKFLFLFFARIEQNISKPAARRSSQSRAKVRDKLGIDDEKLQKAAR